MAASVVLLFLVGIVSALFLMVWRWSNSRDRKMMLKIPGPPDLPIIGNAHMFKPTGRDFWRQVLEFCDMYAHEGIFRLYLGPQPVVVFTKADKAEFLLNTTKHMTKAPEYRFLHRWLGTGLLTSTGAKWKQRRRMLTPTFHFKILTDFLHIFNEQGAVMTQMLESKVGKGQFDMFPFITLCALDIICETAMGKNVSAQKNSDSAYVKAIYQIGEIIQQRQKKPWLWYDPLFDLMKIGKEHSEYLSILHGFTNKIINERRVQFKNEQKENQQNGVSAAQSDDIGKKKRLAFLDMLLSMAEKDPSWTHDDIREEVDTFMFEGHDTTAAAANWAVHLIGANPDVQQKIHEELDAVTGGEDRPLTTDDLRDLKYLECVIKETLRLFPSVPMFAREIEEESKVGGYTIPKSATGIIVTPALHRDPAHFPDPEKFDPDRWQPDNCAGRHPYCYVPFSAGMRNCIGQKFAMMEEKVLLSSIFRYYRIEACQTREQLEPVGEIILRPEHGIQVKIFKREQTN